MKAQFLAEKAQAHHGLHLEDHPAYLFASLKGVKSSVETYLACFSAITRECRVRRHKRVLVVDALQPDLAFLEVCALVNRLFSIGVPGLTLAWARIECANPEHYLFGETMALNQGMNLKVFFQMAAAERWLLSSVPSAPVPSPKPAGRLSAARKTESVGRNRLA